jgi:two-component system, response regulator YesN
MNGEVYMPILSKRLMQAVRKEVRAFGSPPPRFLDLAGHCIAGQDPLEGLSNSRRSRSYALQESINLSKPYLYSVVPGIMTWVLGLEDRRMILGSLVGAEVMVSDGPDPTDDTLVRLVRKGLAPAAAEAFVAKLKVWPLAQIEDVAIQTQEAFYALSGWQPELMQERRRQIRQQEQINEAIADVRGRGGAALYAFEKERILLSNIRAGDRNTSRRILNEMLATIYMSAPQLVVLRARVIELLSCLTRAAIEDNPLMEPLIVRNHTWTDQLIRSQSFEELSECLMRALDDFIDGIYLHGVNRSNAHVHKAMEYIGQAYAGPISLRDVAAYVGLSSCRLAHLIKDYTGQTVLQVIHSVRIRRAQELLDQSVDSCADVAYAVGFGDQSYFTHLFKRHTGMTPARYRRRRG